MPTSARRVAPLAALARDAAARPLSSEGPSLDLWQAVAEVMETVPAEALPEPYRSLLVHDDDMTSTLAAFHGEPIDLRVLAREEVGGTLRRRVTLVARESGTVVEVGAIEIALDAFAAAARAAIRAGTSPLGSILVAHAVPFVSRPHGFFRVAAAALAAEAAIDPSGAAWGRRNRLSTPRGELLAEVVEILPPLAVADRALGG